MNKKEDTFDGLIEKLKKQNPKIPDKQKLTNDIMRQIHNREQRKRSLSHLWLKRSSIAAAILLSVLFAYEELFIPNLIDKDSNGYFITIENQSINQCINNSLTHAELYHCYIKTKQREKETIKQLINYFGYEDNN